MQLDDPGEQNRLAKQLFAPLPHRYDQLAEVLSMGQNRRWREAMVERAVAGGPGLVLDVASGTAGVALELAARGAGRIVGVDVTYPMLEQGRRNIAAKDMAGRVQLVAGRAEQLPFDDATFDALTFTYLLRYVRDPQATLRELARVVKPGGVVASLEFLVPPQRFWRSWWWLYTRAILPAAGWLTGGREWWRVGRFLGPSISNHYERYPLRWTVKAWERVGLTGVTVRTMSLGGGLVMWGARAVA